MAGKENCSGSNNESSKLDTINQIQEIMESISGGVVAITVDDDGQIDLIFANDAYFRMIGHTRKSFFLSKPNLYDLIHSDDRNMVIQKTIQASIDKKPFEMTYRIAVPGKDVIWCESKIAIKMITGIKLPVQIVIINDITERVNAEEEKRVHAEEMKIAMEQMGKLICEYDVKKRILHIPETYANWYGLPMSVKDMPFRVREKTILASESIESFIWFYEEIQRGVRTDNIEVRIRRLDGSWHWERYEFKSIFDNEGKPVKAIIIIEDITHQYDARDEFEREHKLRKELIKDALIYYKVNLSTGIIEEFYSKLGDVPSMCTSVKVSDDVHRGILYNIPPEYHDLVSNTLFSDAMKKSYKRGERSMYLEYRRRLPKAGLRWVKAIGSFMERPNTGEIIAFIHIHDYEIEKKNQFAFEAVLSQEIEAVCIVNVKSQMVRIPNMQSDIAYADKYRACDYDEHIMGRSAVVVATEDRNYYLHNLLFENLIETLEKHDKVAFTYRVVEKDGTIKRKRTTGFYVDESHEDIILSRRDITALYLEEQQQKIELQKAISLANKANAAKDEFISRMSHDMRTPLNTILLLSSKEMLFDSSDIEKEQWISDIHLSAEYLHGLINDVLDVSMMSTQNLKLEAEPFLITDFEHMIETTIGERCKEKGIEFRFDCKYIEYPWIMTDKTRFCQIFINLLSNAVKYTPIGGKIDFEIETIGYEDDRPLKQFIVRDNGIGMSSDFLPRAFDSFSQERREYAQENNQGAGLGLSIVKRLVELMSGTITVKSQLGRGTEFTVVLPLDRANPVETTEVDEKMLQRLQGKRILICEDHALNAKITGVLLEKRGCITEWAENGKVGLDMFRNSEEGYYDAILMDIRMPIMDGWEATSVIRELKRKDAQTIPIIALTADAFSTNECLSQSRGMSGYLSKPVDTLLMYEIIATQVM